MRPPLSEPLSPTMRLVVGNWKMHTLPAEAAQLAHDIVTHEGIAARADADVRVVVCPPAVSLHRVLHAIDGTPVMLGAQDGHQDDRGAFTGNVSMPMLAASSCAYVIVGHSERRKYQGEDNHIVRKKLLAAQRAGITPIVCIGEHLHERTANHTRNVILTQLREIFATDGEIPAAGAVVAYEPVWAIGTGLAATADQIEEVHMMADDYLGTLGFDLPILYGGSVTAENAAEIFACNGVRGALVGGASLKAESFAGIVCA